MYKIDFNEPIHIHFIGIGGISMSGLAEILLKEGYITKYEVLEDGVFKTIHITLKYGADKNEKVITGLRRISKPGLRRPVPHPAGKCRGWSVRPVHRDPDTPT